jgi:iron complex transport system ATP-binding protein
MAEASTTSEQAAQLRAEGVGHQFQPHWWCLRAIDVEVRPGELAGLVGPNGAGKTTLLRALAGLYRPTEGRVALDGRPLTGWRRQEIARRIGFLPQGVRSSFNFTVEEVVAQGRYPHQRGLGILGREDLRVVRRAMEWTNTLAFARRPLADLSSGERQLALLASVLAQGGEFILLDEPTSNLDLHHQVAVFDRIRELARQGLGLMVITHDLNLAAQYCDRLLLLHQGKLAAAGPPAEVLREDLLREVYQTEVIVDRNPVTGAPMVVVPGRMTTAPGAPGIGQTEPRP